jgi:hypothetical protein
MTRSRWSPRHFWHDLGVGTQGRIGALFLALVVLATAACGGAESDQAEVTGILPDSLQDSAEPEESDAIGDEDEATGDPGAADADSSVRRELGLALRPESDVATNLLPPVEVHDVGQDRMVNFKNIFPAERPVLLWMWAPF